MSAVIESRKTKAKTIAAVTVKLTQPSIGEMVDSLVAIRERKRAADAVVAEIEGEYKAIEEQLLAVLAEQKLDGSRGKLGSASVSTSTVANVTDWDALFKYVKKTGFFHLFQRRLTDASYRELLESGKTVPGVEPFIKKRLNLKTL